MYNDLITFYSKTPPNKWILEDYTIKHYEENSVCWDDLEVYLKIEDWKIKNFSFDGDTAIITTACASILWENIIWMTLKEVMEKNYDYIESLIWMPVSTRRRNAAVLWLLTVINALHKYLEDWQNIDFDDLIS